MIKHLICVSCFFTVFLHVQGQTRIPNLSELNEYKLGNVYNYNRDMLRIADYKGKVVILDFWSFSCTSCFKSFPKLDSLQKKYGDDLQIILVNKEGLQQTDSFLKKRIRIFKPDLPMITSDQVLHKIFPHSGVPFIVYIDREGKLLYQTNEVNGSIVSGILQGKDLGLKKPIYKKYVRSFVDTSYAKDVLYYSGISKANKSFEFGGGDPFRDGSYISINFASAPMLFQSAYELLGGSKVDYSKPGRTIAQYQDTADLRPPTGGASQYDPWVEKYAYNYQIFWKGASMQMASRKFITDLESYFKLKVTLEKRKVRCYVLKQMGSIARLHSKGGDQRILLADRGYLSTAADTLTLLQNVPFSMLVDWIRIPTEFNVAPFFNDVKFEGNIDIQFPIGTFEVFQIATIRETLRKYNLDLVAEQRLIDVLVIKK